MALSHIAFSDIDQILVRQSRASINFTKGFNSILDSKEGLKSSHTCLREGRYLIGFHALPCNLIVMVWPSCKAAISSVPGCALETIGGAIDLTVKDVVMADNVWKIWLSVFPWARKSLQQTLTWH